VFVDLVTELSVASKATANSLSVGTTIVVEAIPVMCPYVSKVISWITVFPELSTEACDDVSS
jgi:hypothetical protein